MRPSVRPLILAPLVLACACNGDSLGKGTVQVFLEAEDTIPEGLEPGTGEEKIADGWTVKYDKFIVTWGRFHASRSAAPTDTVSDENFWVVDMTALPTSGFVPVTFKDVAAARWDKVGFSLINAVASAKRAEFTAQADFDRMVAGGFSIYFEATLTKPDGKSCKPTAPMDCADAKEVKIAWGVKGGTSFDDCAPSMGDSGFAVPAGGTVQVKPTIHGDHWFFSNITQGAELTERLAQWIVDSDLDRNGNTTIEELKAVKASDVFKAPTYNLSGAIIPINTAFDYLEAQTRTLGDYQGDGECPTRKVVP